LKFTNVQVVNPFHIHLSFNEPVMHFYFYQVMTAFKRWRLCHM